MGFAWSHELCAYPVSVPTDADFALGIYYRAKQIDYWPGEDYDGTSVLAGVKAVMEIAGEHDLPLYGGYKWAFGLEDVIRTLGHKGPVVLGVNWYEGMYDTDDAGFIHVEGQWVGGHAILARGVNLTWIDPYGPAEMYNVDLDKSFVRLRNSWGRYWGFNGDCRLSLKDLDILLHEQGEACIVEGRNMLGGVDSV